MRCDLRDLLHRRDSLYRHRDFAAGLRLASFVLTFVSAAIRPGLRCMDKLHTTGICADLVIGAARAANIDRFTQSAVEPTHASGLITKTNRRCSYV